MLLAQGVVGVYGEGPRRCLRTRQKSEETRAVDNLRCQDEERFRFGTLTGGLEDPLRFEALIAHRCSGCSIPLAATYPFNQ